MAIAKVLTTIKEFIESSKRVLTVAKKPSMKEFSIMAKVVGLGIIVIGMIGYIVILIFTAFKLGI